MLEAMTRPFVESEVGVVLEPYKATSCHLSFRALFGCSFQVKCLMLQLLDAVAYMHDNWVIHRCAWVLGVGLYSLSILLGCVRHGGRYCMCRDLKMSNLLYKSGELKVADFGLARTFGYPNPKFTPKVCSRTQLGCCPRAVRHRYVWL
jgi:serine/threonine protein kinase